jgi:hypothetical protein
MLILLLEGGGQAPALCAADQTSRVDGTSCEECPEGMLATNTNECAPCNASE